MSGQGQNEILMKQTSVTTHTSYVSTTGPSAADANAGRLYHWHGLRVLWYGVLLTSVCLLALLLLGGSRFGDPSVVQSAPALADLPAVATVAPPVSSTPDPVRVRAGSIVVPTGATTVSVPIDLVVLTDRIGVGVFSASVAYDASLLQATGCVQKPPLDLLLCRVAEPGVVKMAALSALGVRGEATVAEVTFELLQKASYRSPLTVGVSLLGDAAGTTVGATAVHGVLEFDCEPNGDEPCLSGETIYLPVVRR